MTSIHVNNLACILKGKAGFIFFLFIHITSSWTQTKLYHTSDLLRNVDNDSSLQLLKKQIDFENSHHPKLSYLEKVSIQTETNRYEFKREEYVSKFYMNGRREINAVRNKYNLVNEKNDLLYLKLKNDKLTFLYQLFNQYFHLNQELSEYNYLLDILDKKVSYYKSLAQATVNFDIADWLKTEEEKVVTSQRRAGTLVQKNINLALIQEKTSHVFDPMLIDTSQWINLTDIQDITSLYLLGGDMNLDVLIQKKERDIQAANLRITKANEKQIFDYSQLKYNTRSSSPVNKEVSVGLGFLIPYSGSKHLLVDELDLKMRQEDIQLQTMEWKWRMDCKNLSSGIVIKLNQFNKLLEDWKSSMSIFSSPAWVQSGKLTPLEVLKIEELNTKVKIHSIELSQAIYTDYYQFLSLNAKFIAQPNKNYCLHSFPIIIMPYEK